MGYESRFDRNPEPLEDQRAGIGRRCSLRVEIDFHSRKVLQRFDPRSDENVDLGWEKVEDISDAVTNLWNTPGELVQHVRVHDRKVNATQVKKSVDIFGRSS